MPSSTRYVRVPVFVSRLVLRRVDGLAAQYGVNRSIVVRAALDRGLPSASRDLRKLHARRLQATGVTTADPGVPGSAAAVLSLEDAVERLRVFGDAVRIGGERPDEPSLRDVLHAHAGTLPIAADDFDDAVAEALSLVVSGAEEVSPVRRRRDPNRPPD